MAACISQLSLEFHPTGPIRVAFDAPQISSDGGLLLVRQMDDRLGLSQRLAALLPDERDPSKVKHARREQVRQRLYQIALGYADCNDADRLRHDPLLKSVCERTPQAEGLSSQPTLSRLENAVDAPTLRAILLTAAHEPSTREKLRRVVEGSLMGVSQLGGDDHDRLIRSGLISSQIMGLALMRYVWKVEPVASMTEDEVLAAIAPNLQHYIEGDLAESRTLPR